MILFPRAPLALFAVGLLASVSVSAQTAAPGAREELPGAVNYTRVDAVVACGGATTPDALKELKARGFKAVLNLRQASEPEAKVEEEGALVRSLGLTYLHVPMNGSAPTDASADQFLAALDDASQRPIYIHCGTANRVGAMWYIKRVLRDGWDPDKAMAEAKGIGLKSPVLEEFAQNYVKARRK